MRHLGFNRTIGSYISSFITDKFETQMNKYQQANVVAYNTDIGFILIDVVSILGDQLLYLANPISHQCLEITPRALLHDFFCPLEIVTQTKNGVVLGYKVVMFDGKQRGPIITKITFLIYSSETQLWSLNTVHFPFSFSFNRDFHHPISLNENLHWLIRNSEDTEVVVSIDFYDIGTSSYRCRVTPFPDLEKHPKFIRTCTTSEGFLMYMNIISDEGLDDKLCVWRLKSGEWQLVSEISPTFIETGFEYLPLAINPFDANIVYLWSWKHQSLLFINLLNGNFMIHNQIEYNDQTYIIKSVNCPVVMKIIQKIRCCLFCLPQWLYRIPDIT